MTELAFHFNVADKTSYACRLLRKAHGSGARVVVTGPAAVMKALDLVLWTFSALEFIPHCLASSDTAVLAASPVVLCSDLGDESPELPHQQVLVNLGADVPSGFERFERLIEVVSQSEDDRLTARRRWKYYADRGYAIQRHDVVNPAAS